MGINDWGVCHLEFCGGNTLERQKHALQDLTHCPESQLQSLRSKEDAQVELYRRVKGKRVLLILDNIETDESIGEARDYLRAELGEGSCILLIGRTVEFLQNNFSVNSQSCMGVPRLTEEEATTILLEKALEKPALSHFCKYAFGIRTIPSDPHFDIELLEQVQAECRALPVAVQRIVIFNYHRDDFLSRLKTSIDVLDDDEKQCFLDLAAFPQKKFIPANALLDIWVYVRGMTRDKTAVLILKFAARHLLHLRRDARLPTIRDNCMNSYTFSQDDAVRNLALFLAKCDDRIHFRRMYVSQKLFQFYESWQTDMNQSSEAQIVSIRTVEMAETQWPQMNFPEAEALILYFTANEYCIPPFLFKMEKLKVLIINNDSDEQVELTGPDNFQVHFQLKTLHLEGLIVPSLLEHCRVFSKSLEKIRLSRCKNLGRDTVFDFSRLLECYVDSCTDLKEFPAGICSSTSLKVLSITSCGNLKKLPNDLDRLGSLTEIRLCGCSWLKALPPSICELTKLEILDISQCTGLYVNGEGRSVFKEILQKLAKLPSFKCVICDKHIKKIFKSSFRPGLLKVGLE
ncbi:hypothetical protein SUGI_0868850 [Cryptomeria japonica]|nr:hypothetical protein SUGI_0868850 [Cryptomeria japonica]